MRAVCTIMPSCIESKKASAAPGARYAIGKIHFHFLRVPICFPLAKTMLNRSQLPANETSPKRPICFQKTASSGAPAVRARKLVLSIRARLNIPAPRLREVGFHRRLSTTASTIAVQKTELAKVSQFKYSIKATRFRDLSRVFE